MRFDVKELAEVFEKYGIDTAEAFSAVEESTTYGTNCFDLVFSDEPYVGLRFFYDSLNEKLIPVVVRIRIDKRKHKLPKEVLERTLPALLAAEEDEDTILLAVRVPRAPTLTQLVDMMIELTNALKKTLGEQGGAGIVGYVPTDCSPFIHLIEKA